MRDRSLLLGAALSLLMVAGVSTTGMAQEPMQPAEPTAAEVLVDPRAAALDAQAAEIAGQLRCPVCSGQSVLESNSAIAQEMQAVIRERLDAGDSESEVLEYFRGSYGDWIVLRPEPEGLNLIVYILPAVVLLIGLGALVVVGRRWVGAGAAPPPSLSVESAPAGTGDRPHGLSAEDEAWLRQSMGG